MGFTKLSRFKSWRAHGQLVRDNFGVAWVVLALWRDVSRPVSVLAYEREPPRQGRPFLSSSLTFGEGLVWLDLFGERRLDALDCLLQEGIGIRE